MTKKNTTKKVYTMTVFYPDARKFGDPDDSEHLFFRTLKGLKIAEKRIVKRLKALDVNFVIVK
jgi:hypothetical protein